MRAKRTAAAALVVGLLAAACGSGDEGPARARGSRDAATAVAPAPGASGEGAPATAGAARSPRSAATARAGSVPAAEIPAPASRSGPAMGVSDKEITVVYYWKGDRTRTSPFLRGTGQESLVDEGEAFLGWVDYINRHASGGGDIMGFPFTLHGRRIKPVVIEAGSSPEDNVAAVSDIRAAKPFAAVAAHGSISTYACPRLAQAGIVNLWTYDLDFDLSGRTKGWCLPGGATFDDQVSVMERYLPRRVARSRTSAGQPRVFGMLYAEYPGLVDSAPVVARRLEAKGIRIAERRSISADLGEAQQQATGIATAFRAAGVNTLIIPDAGAPIAFTAAAEAIGYEPDYVVWPCSGQDQTAMVRLYTSTQWERATGLTCYAQDFMIDLTHGEDNRDTEWYRKYAALGRGEPAAQAPFIYAALLPLVTGITHAGRSLDPESFLEGVDRFRSYRYSALEGRTSKAPHMRLALAQTGRPLVDDYTILRWSPSARYDGKPGAYVFPENGRRYAKDAGF